MAREEIQKQVIYLSREILSARFTADGTVLEFDAPSDMAGQLTAQVEALARRIQRGLRDVRRKVVFQSEAAGNPRFRGFGSDVGIHQLGTGQVCA